MPQSEPAVPPGPRQRRRQAAQRRLLQAGLALMAEKSLAACKVEEITAAAGVGKGTFFTHFASKEAYVARLVEMVLADLARRVRPLGLMPGEAESLLAGVGGVHLRYFQLRPEAAALIVQACGLDGGSPAGAAVRAALTAHLDGLAAMLAPAAAHLGWPDGRGRELALMLLAQATGFFWFGRGLGVLDDVPVNLLDRMGRVLARGLAEPAPANPTQTHGSQR